MNMAEKESGSVETKADHQLFSVFFYVLPSQITFHKEMMTMKMMRWLLVIIIQ